MRQLRLLCISWLIVLFTAIWVVGCSGDTNIPATPTPQSAPTLPGSGVTVIPNVSCDQGVQLILQKQVHVVTIYYSQGTQIVAAIFMDMQNGSQQAINDIYQCDSRLAAAAKKVNATLPKNQQIVVKHATEAGG